MLIRPNIINSNTELLRIRRAATKPDPVPAPVPAVKRKSRLPWILLVAVIAAIAIITIVIFT
jgi:hypothetical protein